jgi:hypothetical protein
MSGVNYPDQPVRIIVAEHLNQRDDTRERRALGAATAVDERRAGAVRGGGLARGEPTSLSGHVKRINGRQLSSGQTQRRRSSPLMRKRDRGRAAPAVRDFGFAGSD